MGATFEGKQPPPKAANVFDPKVSIFKDQKDSLQSPIDSIVAISHHQQKLSSK